MGYKRKKNGKKYREIPTSPSAPRNDRKTGGKPEFDVRIRISKRPNTDHFTGDIQANNTKSLLEALAVMMQRAAALLGAPTEQVYAVVATLLFKEEDTGDPAPEGET